MSVKRYTNGADDDQGTILPFMEESPNGDYVEYSDYAALLAATQWRPIETAYTEYLKGKDVLLLFDNGKVESASVSEGAGVWFFSTHDGCNVMVQYDGVTHWMPLPKPPAV